MLMTRTTGASQGLLGGALVTCPVVTKPEFFSQFLEILAFAWVS
jgi:hypothetical protein